MALTRAQYLSGNTANGVVLSGQPQGVRPGGAGISIASDGTISVDSSTVTGVVKLNNVSAYNAYVWPTSAPSASSALTTNATGTLTWTPIGGGGIGSVTSVNVSGGTTGMVFSGGPVTTSGTITMDGILGIANGGTGSNTREGALNDLLPPQFGNAGYVLTTDGSNTSWTNPSQGAVTRLVAGSNVTISPTTGVGVVTINASGGGGSGGLTGLQEIDDISGSFNGAITTFSITVSGGQPIPDGPGTGQLVIAVGGVLQTPGDAFTFNNATDTLTFTSPPPAGVSFTGYVGGSANPITEIITTSPLSGGGTSGPITIGMAASGVAAGVYTNPNLTIDAFGRVTSASNGSAALPSQGGQGTKFLTTNGSAASWSALRTPLVTATSVTAAANDYVVVTASGQTITLPASPYAGAVVTVVVAGTFLNTVVARNGSNIMGLAENLTLDKPYAAMQFTYTDASNGWRLN